MSSGRLLVSPVFTGAVAVLAPNDQVLEAGHPGLLTGKLSDVAGVVVVSVALAAVTRRASVAVVATSALFALLKLLPVVAVAAGLGGGR